MSGPVEHGMASVAAYAAFPPEPDRDWLGRVCHLSAADLTLIRRRSEPVTQLGYATQLATVRAIGTFQADPTAVPEPLVSALARQLGIAEPGLLAQYREMAVRWRHTAEIRERHGYRDFATQPDRFAFTCWLYRQAWADEIAPAVLFRAAHRQLLARAILLPGRSVLARVIASVRERATHRAHQRLLRATPTELRARLEKLLLVPEGQRRSELDLLRRPPFTPTIGGLIRALDRLDRVRALGAGDLDLSGIPPARVVTLARYADQAWATQLADLGLERRIATLTAYTHLLSGSARDDVIDIFDVVFGDMQRAATHRGEKRRVGELRDYDTAVAAVHQRMRALLDALADAPVLARVLDTFRIEQPGIEENMDTIETLMRPPGDPFHERLIAAYPQIRRFLPGSTRWGDPRSELLPQRAWTDRRETLCEDLALDPDPPAVIAQLTDTLDTAWRRTAAGYAANPDLRIEHRHGRDEIVLTPLDANPEPASLVALRGEVEKLLPEVEIADLPLEVHSWTGFLDEYTPISGAQTPRGRPAGDAVGPAGLRGVQRRAHPRRRRHLSAAGAGAVELGGAQLPALGHPRGREHPARRLPHTAAAGAGLGRRRHGYRRRDALRHPGLDHPRRLQPALLRPATGLDALLVDGRLLHRGLSHF